MTTSSDHQDEQGTILEIVRMSTEDGPGIRTTVFFKGCSLACRWCHNPESIQFEPQVQWLGTGCIGCGICVATCLQKALTQTARGIVINHAACIGCGKCAQECPSAAMELLGKTWYARKLALELARDRAYFESSSGGVTLSGGEAALQGTFCLALLKALREQGIQTALDTCGQTPRLVLERLLPYVDFVLYDLKEIDPVRHKAFTGVGNERILENARFVAEYVKTHIRPPTLWLRTPVIPGATDTPENIRGLGAFIRDHLSCTVERWELCAFNNLCRDKYTRLGLSWPYAEALLMPKSRMDQLAQIAKSVVSPSIVFWSGPTRLGNDIESDVKLENRTSFRVC